MVELTCKINKMQAAVRPDACHVVQPIYNDGQNTV